MPRRSPTDVRVEASLMPRLGERVPVPSGVSPAGVAAIAKLERARYWPGAIVYAMRRLEELANTGPRRSDPDRCGDLLCCGTAAELLPMVEAAVRVLPQRDARKLRSRLTDLEQRLYPYGRDV